MTTGNNAISHSEISPNEEPSFVVLGKISELTLGGGATVRDGQVDGTFMKEMITQPTIGTFSVHNPDQDGSKMRAKSVSFLDLKPGII